MMKPTLASLLYYQPILKNLATSLPICSHERKPNFTSQILTIKETTFVSLDITAFQCKPYSNQTNPSQYLLAINPPLQISNFTFSPLDCVLNNPTGRELLV